MKFLILFFFILKQSLQLCNDNNCPYNSGECISDLCLCAPGYTTYHFPYESKEETRVFCNYALKYKNVKTSSSMARVAFEIISILKNSKRYKFNLIRRNIQY